jgi:diguanylate cyclase (GGDEF)-like protein
VGSGIALRLTALVLLPLLLSMATATWVIITAESSVRSLSRLQARIPAMDAYLQASLAVQNELSAIQISVRPASLPPAMRPLGQGMGFDYNMAGTQKLTDAAMTKLEPYVPAAREYAESLKQTRALAASPKPDADTIYSQYRVLSQNVQDDMDKAAADLDSMDSQAGGAALIVSMHVLSNLGAAMHYRGNQLNDVASLALGSDRPRAAILTEFGTDTGLYQAANKALLTTPMHGVTDEWSSLLHKPEVVQLDKLLARYQNGADPALDTNYLSELAATAKITPELGAGVRSLTEQTDSALTAQAQKARATLDTRLEATWGACLLSLLIVILGALRISRSIRNPLRRLEEGAESVNMGGLKLAPLEVRGPREIKKVTRAFNDLVSNLRLLEAKSLALAELDLDNPALAEPLQGQLGAAIDGSMRVLSASIEERDRLAQQLVYDATHDALTDLPNRASAIVTLDGALARGQRHGHSTAVLFVDLDGFKLINDNHGHEVGDHLLRDVSRRLREAARDGDTVVRLGGDEFLVIIENTDPIGAASFGQRVSEALSEPMSAGHLNLIVGASFGMSLDLDGHGSAAELLSRAELALDRAKSRGRGTLEIFDESLQQELHNRSEIEYALRATLERGGDELELHYQPVICGATQRLQGVEALIRWNRPDIGRVAPDDFIPVAELSSLIIDLDRWVLTTAIRQGAAWQQIPGLQDLEIAINVSGRHLLSGQLSEHVDNALLGVNLPRHTLILEITETVLITDLASVAVHLKKIRDKGIKIAIDDFGTGFTSLAALRSLPMDIIKIDRSFVSNIEEAASRSVVSMVTRLGHELQVSITAEGVETAEQLAILNELGADELQGYLISRPLPAADFAATFSRQPAS